MKFEYTEKNIGYVMDLIRENLSPDLLSPRFRDKNKNNPMYGHCTHASKALVLLMDTDKLKLMHNKHPSWAHMWVQDGNQIYDVTVDQFYFVGCFPNYENPIEVECVSNPKVDLLIDRILRVYKGPVQIWV